MTGPEHERQNQGKGEGKSKCAGNYVGSTSGNAQNPVVTSSANA